MTEPARVVAFAIILAALPARAQTPPTPAPTELVPPDQAQGILGRRVSGPEGQDVGRLVDVLVDADGKPIAGILDVGGFLGMGNRRVAVAWSALRFAIDNKDKPIWLTVAPDWIKSAPESKDPQKPAAVVTPPASTN